MASIFRALDGGHLDRALFGRHTVARRKVTEGEKAQRVLLSRHSPGDRREESGCGEQGAPSLKAGSDSGS